MDVFFVYVTAADEAEAEQIARIVVGERLAACANLLGAIQSVYWWEGKVCEGNEAALVLKTSQVRKDELVARIKQLHSYDCPGITCLPVDGGNPDFLEWVEKETEKLQS